MNRPVRAMIVGTVGTTLLAALVALCPCPGLAPALAGEHGCCRPETTMTSADSDCCPSLSTAARLGPTPRPEPSVAPVTAPVDFAPSLVEHDGVRTLSHSSSPPLFSPPTVLRI